MHKKTIKEITTPFTEKEMEKNLEEIVGINGNMNKSIYVLGSIISVILCIYIQIFKYLT